MYLNVTDYLQSDHAQVMEATYGGTEISKAVQAVFLSRNSFLPSVVFVLTDGQVCVHRMQCTTES